MFDSPADPSILSDEIHAHCEMIHRLAAPLSGQGKLVIACFGEAPAQLNPKTGRPGCPLPPCVVHVQIGDVDTTIRTVANLTANEHHNVYMPLAVFRPDVPKGKKGFERDIVAVLGLVADFDDADAAQWVERLPVAPNFVLKTSTGRFQAFHLFDKLEAFAAAKPVAARLKAFAGCDHGTADLSHVWRIAGTLNWPNAKKVGAGRPSEPQTVRVVKDWHGTTTSLEALAGALPTSERKTRAWKQEGNEAAPDDGNTTENEPAEGADGTDEADTAARGDAGLAVEIIVRLLPPKLRDRITQPASGDRSRNLFFVVSGLIARDLDDSTIKRIIQHYRTGIGEKYVGRADLDREIARIRVKRSRRQTAEADAAASPAEGRPVIKVRGGALPIVVDQAEAALIERDPDIYELGDVLVRPAIEPIRIAKDRTTGGLRLVSIGPNDLIERMTKAADFQRFDKRSGEFFSVDCPKAVAATYLERVGKRRLRRLTAITTCPVLRPDGTVLDKPGFDESTGILYDPQGVEFPAISAAPTWAGAVAALAELKLLISEFPFVDGPDRSVALSGIVTGVSRLAVSFAPMHAFDAPSAGTGKSKLVDCCSLIATGHEAPVIAQGKTEEEMEKRLGAALISGDRIISIDNCECPLGGELLCQGLTQRFLKPRILGKSLNVTVPNTALYFSTGTNLRLVGDMSRRAIVGRLDAGVERPEDREFVTEDPIDTLKRERARYVVAALTVLRAFIVAGSPKQVRPLGGFEEWSRLVRDALIWLGEPDPLHTMARVREQDPHREALAAVLDQWNAVLQTKRVSAKEVIDAATDFDLEDGLGGRRRFLHPEFREALLIVAGDSGNINSRRLGMWLGANNGKIINSLRIISDGISGGIARYRIQRLYNGRWE